MPVNYNDHNHNAGSGDPAFNPVGPVPSPGEPPGVELPRRRRRLHRVWPDRDGNISYLLTLCVDGRRPVLNNDATFERLVTFLLDSPSRYGWFGRRFVIMPDHLHVIAHMGSDAVRLGNWIKVLKAFVAGLKPREDGAGSGDPAFNPVGPVPSPGGSIHIVGPVPLPGDSPSVVGRVPSRGAPAAGRLSTTRNSADVGRVPLPGVPNAVGPVPSPVDPHPFTRISHTWRWQSGFDDHKFRTPESESRKWEYICLNPVRAKHVDRPELWPFGGEIFYDEPAGPRLIRGTPPLLETGMLIFETPQNPPGEATRPST